MAPKKSAKKAAPAAEASSSSASAAATPSKRAKGSVAGHRFNANSALDKAHENKPLKEIIKLPPSALQGLAERCDPLFKAFHIKTIHDLAHWKHARIAQAVLTLAATEQKDKRAAGSEMNIHKAVDKDYQNKTFQELLDAPVSALKGLAEWSEAVFAKMHIKTIRDLANWKYISWAVALDILADQEE